MKELRDTTTYLDFEKHNTYSYKQLMFIFSILFLAICFFVIEFKSENVIYQSEKEPVTLLLTRVNGSKYIKTFYLPKSRKLIGIEDNYSGVFNNQRVAYLYYTHKRIFPLIDIRINIQNGVESFIVLKR